MFTGLVETLGIVKRIETAGAGRRLGLEAPSIAAALNVGESVAVNGVCLTVIAHDEQCCTFEAGPETLRRTNLGELSVGERVNLERALRLGDRLGGHVVQGHVDGVGRILERKKQGEWEVIWFSSSADLAEQMVPKGSVAVDGVSLTVVDVADERFSVALIPHTLANTTLGFKSAGASVNLETDLFAKYIWKCLKKGEVTPELLARSGFIPPRESLS
jgi:riboflavin synthase